MSFAWLDDDEIVDDAGDSAYGKSQTSTAGGTSGGMYSASRKSTAAAAAAATANSSVLRCNNCGSTDSYMNHASGLRVCSDCFTTHLQSQQETTEFEEVQNLAAKTRGGAFRFSAGNGTAKRKYRKLLADFDSSQALPELESCLQAMKLVLGACTEKLSNEILATWSNNTLQPSICVLTEEHPKRLKRTVRDLWMAYLRSWADGAQYYGTLYPHARFCMRDSFVSWNHRDLLGRVLEEKHLADAPAVTTTPLLAKDKAASHKKKQKKKVAFDIKDDKGYSDDEGDDSARDDDFDDDDSEDNDEGEEEPMANHGDEAEFSANAAKGSRKKTTRITQFTFMKNLIYRHCREHHQTFDSKTAALLTRPSMHLVAAILLLALRANNVVIPTFEFLRWIESGQLPLKTAFDDLIPSTCGLKKQLKLVSWFFQSYRQPIPARFDRLVAALAVACRIRSNAYELCYRRNGCFSFVSHQFIWDGPLTLALRMAQFSAAAGLPRNVLDRALLLVGLPPTADVSLNNEEEEADEYLSTGSSDDSSTSSSSNNSSSSGGSSDSNSSTDPWQVNASTTSKPATEVKSFDFMGPNTIKGIPQVAHPQDVATPEDVLALLAIACQFDPDWREWKYYKTSSSSKQHFVMPHNESELLSLDNPGRYLKHCYEKICLGMQHQNDDQTEQTLPIPKDLFSEHELKVGGDEASASVGEPDKSLVSSNVSVDASRDSSRHAKQGPAKRRAGSPKPMTSNSDGFESDDLFGEQQAKKDSMEAPNVKNDGFESDDLFGGQQTKKCSMAGTNVKSDGFESDDLFGGPARKRSSKELIGDEKGDGFESDDIFGVYSKPIASKVVKGGRHGTSSIMPERGLTTRRDDSDSDDHSASDLTKELLGGTDKQKGQDEDDKTSADKPSASRNSRKRSRGKMAVIDGSDSDDDLSASSFRKLESQDSVHDDNKEVAWGLQPLKPATLLKPNDMICGMSLSPEAFKPQGTKRLRDEDDDDDNGKTSPPQEPQQQKQHGRPPRIDFSHCNLAVQWMDASLPRVDPKVLQLLQHLAYSADLVSIDRVEDLMVYYLQGRGIARHTFRQSGLQISARCFSDQDTCELPIRLKLPKHLWSRFSWAGRPGRVQPKSRLPKAARSNEGH